MWPPRRLRWSRCLGEGSGRLESRDLRRPASAWRPGRWPAFSRREGVLQLHASLVQGLAEDARLCARRGDVSDVLYRRDASGVFEVEVCHLPDVVECLEIWARQGAVAVDAS